MSDFIWSVIIGVIFVILGLVFIWLGLVIWKKQRIGLIIKYHMDKVNDKNTHAYCTLFGIGIFVLGIGFAVSGICMTFTTDLLSWLPMGIGLVAGLLLVTISVIRYNH